MEICVGQDWYSTNYSKKLKGYNNHQNHSIKSVLPQYPNQVRTQEKHEPRYKNSQENTCKPNSVVH
jgi:hypothetical protein